jgi:hypothetical protein
MVSRLCANSEAARDATTEKKIAELITNKSKITDSVEQLSVHPSRASGRTEEGVEIIGDFPFMLSLVEAFMGFSAESITQA